MNKARLEWIMSGLNHYKLSATEDRFVKLVEEEFKGKNMLTEEQEGKIESLYREKSKLMPDKPSVSAKQGAAPGKKRFRRFRAKNIY